MQASMEKLEHLLELGGIKKDITLLVISGIAVICSLLQFRPFPFDMAWFAIVLCGLPIILEAMIGLVTAFDIKADVLVSLALIASVCIGQIFAAGEVAFIMQLGALLEEVTVAKARAGIEKLVHLTPQTARVLKGGKETVIPAEQVQVGDLLRVLPGETIPVDGVIVSGQTSINQAVMTGGSRALWCWPIRCGRTASRCLHGSRSFRCSRFCSRATMRRQPIRLQRRSACRTCALGASRRISCAILMTSRRLEARSA